MNTSFSSYPPPPREPDLAPPSTTTSSSYPPPPPPPLSFFSSSAAAAAARRPSSSWDKLPLSQSRAYVSPDPSPRDELFHPRSAGLDADRPGLGHFPRETQTQTPAARATPKIGAYHDHSTPPLAGHLGMNAGMHPGMTLSHSHSHSGGVGLGGFGLSSLGFGPGMGLGEMGMGMGVDMGDADPYYNPAVGVQHAHAHGHGHGGHGHRPQGKKKSAKKAEGKQPTFLTKLYSLLSQPEYGHIIRWDEPGEAIIIENPEELADKILPVVYRQSRFASFSRQLNIYGFNRKLSLRNVERGICDPDASTWSHPFLRRDSTKDEILSFKRRVPPRPSQAQKRRMSMEDAGLSPTSSERSLEFHSPPDAYQHHLLPDVDEDKPFVFAPRGNYWAGPDGGGMGVGGPGGVVGLQAHAGYTAAAEYDQHGEIIAPNGQAGGNPFDFRVDDRATTPRRMAVEIRHTHGPSHLHMPHAPSYAHAHGHAHSHSHGGHGHLQTPRQMPLPLQSSLFPPRNIQDIVPQSAPAMATSFSLPVRVLQDHARTRSVQGEPPSAMLFSPIGGDGGVGREWGEVPEPLNSASAPKESSGELDGGGDGGPTCNPRDAATWAARGIQNANSVGYASIGAHPRLATSPHSLPTDLGMYRPTHGHGVQGHGGVISQAMSVAGLSDDSPTTVSPGVYQHGFSLPNLGSGPGPAPGSAPGSNPSPSQLSTTRNLSGSGDTPAPRGSPPNGRGGARPSAIPGPQTQGQTQRQERRASISASPYSPQARARPGMPAGSLSWGGSLRGVGSRRGSEAGSSVGVGAGGGLGLRLGDGAGAGAGTGDGGLPSASVGLEDRDPFEEIMREGGR
ncbi:hypothetical protein IAT38_000566 [Cryptococcus sp. DSM 104549]